MTSQFRRYIALSEVPVEGFFRYKDVVQVLPAPTEAPRLQADFSLTPFHHPLIVEISFTPSDVGRKSSGYEIPVDTVNIEIAQTRLKHLLLLLTAFCNFRLFTYSFHQAWFVSPGTQANGQLDWSPQWGRESYVLNGFDSEIANFTEPNVAPANLVEAAGYFNSLGRPIGQVVEFPVTISALFDAAFAIPDEARTALLSACSLLDQGIALWQSHPSLSFASCVSALECLIAFDHREEKPEVCRGCGQERYRVMKKFQQFFANYGSNSAEFKKYAQEVYRYRSKILHRGELFLGDVELRKFLSLDGSDVDEFRRSLVRTCRICIANWLLSNHKAVSHTP